MKIFSICITILFILLAGCTKTENVYPVQVVTKTVKCDSTGNGKHHDNDSTDDHDSDGHHGRK